MEVIIDIDKIKDHSKREWLLSTLKLMNIRFQTSEKAQTLEEYNQDPEQGNSEINQGEFITAEKLKAEARKW